MAKPIKETPILTGKDAERFIKEVEKSNNEKLSSAIINRMKSNYSFLKSIAKF